jgi:LPS-assembly lipoprotein
MSARLPSLICALALALASAGCGFHPLYGRTDSNPGAQQVFESIYVDPIEGERAGYELRNSLLDLLKGSSRPEKASYHLKVNIKQTIEAIAVENDASITRYNYDLVAYYELTNGKTGASITKGTETTLAAYDVVPSPYATLVAQQDAQKRGAQDIAYRIRVDLAVYFAHASGTVK